jgi:DNA-binding transcriptional LysR family regulator
MDVAVLRLFLDVCRHGSFAAAARARDLDPSAVSRQIAALEAGLGYRLFDRTTRRLMLSDAGRIAFDRLLAPLEEIEDIRLAGQDAVSQPSGLLRITASVAFGDRWLVPRLAGFRSLYPEIELDLVLTDARLDLAGEGLDVGIRLGADPGDVGACSQLFETRYRLVAAPRYQQDQGCPEKPADIANHACIAFPFSGYRSHWRFRDLSGHIEEVAIRPTVSISNALALRTAALGGLGLALLAGWLVDGDIESGRLVDVFPSVEASASDFDTAAWIVHPVRAYKPAKSRVFADYLQATLTA